MNDTIIHKTRQALEGNTICYDGKRPLRARIKRDSYDSQSWGIIEVWSDHNEWTEIQRYPISEFQIATKSYVAKDGQWEHIMSSDLSNLIAYGHDHLKKI